jgi:hypothetical protein
MVSQEKESVPSIYTWGCVMTTGKMNQRLNLIILWENTLFLSKCRWDLSLSVKPR